VVLNFAEGHDKGSLAEQRRFFRMARGSAQECMAILDVAERLGAVTPQRYAGAHEHADHVVRMLIRFRR
jgi:four helix bundle protein